MTNKEIEEQIKELLKSQDIFRLNSVDDVNHNPHPFTIGPKHITHASDHYGGMLGEATLEKVPCAHPGCNMMYRDHTSDKVVFLSLLRNADSEEVRNVLLPIISIGDNILKGVSFVETEEKFRIHEKV